MLDKSVAHMLSTVASVYAIFVYSIAFALEMWFIFSSDLFDHNLYSFNSPSKFQSTSDLTDSRSNYLASMPIAAFAFILAAIFFICLLVSFLLMLGIIIRSIFCLLIWLVTLAILFLPECGLVLHLALNVWKIDSRNGQIELCFYVVRAIMNVFFMICVQNLLCQWKTEKQVSNYVSSLNAFQGFPGLATVSGLNTLAADPSYFLDAGHSGILSSHSPSFKCNTLGRYNALSSLAPINSFGLVRNNSFKHNPLNYANPFAASSYAEFDARNFQEFMFRKNAFYDDLPDTFSNPHSIDLNKPPVQYSTQSLDRRRFLQQTASRPQWPTISEQQDQVTLKPLSTRPFDYLQRPGSMSNLNTIGKNSNHSSPTLSYTNSFHHNNNNDVNKINLNLQPKINHNSMTKNGLSSSDGNVASNRQSLCKSESNSSLHSIRDIAL